MPKVVCIAVMAKSLLSTICPMAPRLSSMNMRIPVRSLSSRRSRMPSIFLSRTRPAMASSSFALFTW